MRARRLVAEVSREVLRPSSLALVGAFVVASGAFALMAVDGPDWALFFMHVTLPLMFAPLGARMATRDRERGMAGVLATTPLSRGESFAAKAAALLLLLFVAVGLTVPVVAAMLADAGPAALAFEADTFLKALAVGGASGMLGLFAGTLAAGRTTPALSAAFLVAGAWVALTRMAPALLAHAGTGAQRRALLALLHANPVLWAQNAGGPLGGRYAPDSPHPLWGAALLGVAFLLLAAVAALRLQHAEGWLAPTRKQLPALGGALLLLAGTGGALASWDYLEPSPPWREATDYGTPGYLESVWFRPADPADETWVGDGKRVNVQLRVRGGPGDAFELTRLRMESDHVDFRLLDPLPLQTSIPEEATGTTLISVWANFSVGLRYAGDGSIPVHVHAKINGEDVSFATEAPARPPLPPTRAVVAAAGLPSVFLLVGAWALPRRLNRW